MWIQKLTTGTIDRLAYSPDGQTLYAFGSRCLTAWDVATRVGRPFKNTHMPYGWGVAPQGIHPLADGQRIVLLEERYATVLDTNDGRDLGGVKQLTTHKSGLRRVTPDGRLFYLNGPADELRAWNLTTREGEPPRAIPGCRNTVACFDISQDERLVALVGKRGDVTVYERDSGPELRNPIVLPEPTGDVRFSPDGRTLALSDPDSRRVALWDVDSRQPRAKNIRTSLADARFEFNPTLPAFAGPNAKNVLTLFSTETGEAIRSLDFAIGKILKCIAFSPDGLTCAVGGSNKQFAVFDVDV